MEKKRFWQKGWFHVFTAIVFPPIGLFWLWKGRGQRGKAAQIGLTAALCVWMMAWVGIGLAPSAPSEPAEQMQQAELVEINRALPEESEPVKSAPTPAAESRMGQNAGASEQEATEKDGPVAQPEPQPAAEPEPVAQPEPQPAAEPEPVARPEPQPAAESEPAARPEPQPSAEPVPEPVSELQPVQELIPEPIPEPAQQATRMIAPIDGTERTISLSPDTLVWIPASGKKFHSHNDCGSMDPTKARQITFEEAVAKGYPACANCYP